MIDEANKILGLFNQFINNLSKEKDIDKNELMDLWNRTQNIKISKPSISYKNEKKKNKNITKLWKELTPEEKEKWKQIDFEQKYNKICPKLSPSREDHFNKKPENYLRKLVLSTMDENKIDTDITQWTKKQLVDYLCNNT